MPLAIFITGMLSLVYRATIHVTVDFVPKPYLDEDTYEGSAVEWVRMKQRDDE